MLCKGVAIFELSLSRGKALASLRGMWLKSSQVTGPRTTIFLVHMLSKPRINSQDLFAVVFLSVASRRSLMKTSGVRRKLSYTGLQKGEQSRKMSIELVGGS